ncbi:penicillin-binding protein 2 [Aestuariibacter salexigens]|uniref:penicillin-binding protein 2 n=1 Tax=Aestuariibacter salexigens TaxID=226010 RepID=UPI0004053FC5|nr:penicillin-binding protein 2 [Aestuariibacter salexigens]
MPAKRMTIKDHTAEANLFARRTVVALLIVGVMLSVLVSNLYVLQIKKFQDYQTRSNGNRIKVLPVAPNRGLIYDRKGRLLAENRPVYSLEIVPEQVEDIDGVVAELSAMLDISDDEIKDFEQSLKRVRRFKPVALRSRLSEQDVARFAAQQHRFPGVSIEARLTRFYPYADALTHVLGYVARINKKDLQKLREAGQEDNYAATHDIGKQGVERYHEDLLHGEVGYQQVEVNSQGRIIRVLDFDPPTPGQDIVLNIDIDLQMEARKALEGRRGSVVALDPRTGGVMALYSNPSYDPNLFVHGISSKDYSALLNSPDRPLINRATQGQYPPASTIKPHLALVGLEEGIIDSETTLFDRGRYQLKNVSHVWRDWKKYGHGQVDVVKSVEVSCDIFFYDLAYRLGIDRISDAMQQFGFGDYTGIDLYEESDANMPSRGWKRARHNEPWYIGDTISVGIGQSYWTATPLQLADSLMALVNKGSRYVPQIIRGNLVDDEVQLQPVKELRPIPVKNEENWDIVLDSLYGTVNREHGTARSAFSGAHYISGGKTGTAQLFSIGQDEEYEEENVAKHLRDNAMYIGYAPIDAPEIVVAVALENAGGGSSNAAPVARQIMDFHFRDRTFDSLVLNPQDAAEDNESQ